MISANPNARDIFSVTRLNREVKALLETHLGLIWVEAELSNFSRPASGHWYFTLKDERAQVRCAMFRGRNRLLRQAPQHGDRLLVRARLSLYEARGDYQLIVEHMEPAGQGGLQQQYEALKAKLEGEGLFASDGKQNLPPFPRRIGLITSETGAALRDILSVLSRRCPMVPARVYPVPVQGKESAPAIVNALERAQQRNDCDVLIIARGGGSLEDLWPFNEETVVRAIAASRIPIISGVGHETDITLSDFAADLRAPTPSAAAEQAVPDQRALRLSVQSQRQTIENHVRRCLHSWRTELNHVARRLEQQHPRKSLEQHQQRLDDLTPRLHRAIAQRIAQHRVQLKHHQQRLQNQSPRRQLIEARQKLRRTEQQLHRNIADQLQRRRQQWRLAARGLEAVSPLKTLDRGYAIAQRHSGQVIDDANGVTAGEKIRIKLAKGQLDAEVETVLSEDT
ncbi:exodeoxyribonuclease VII, large subunit [gamma proteobacterium HTCC5015]|nr:exodeoxyribonuclease VII, large subunit [gamma proteobacterium HTCC5015]